MTEQDTDFEFDFFEEPATEEGAAGPGRRRAPRRPVRPPSGLTPLLRLVGLIAFAILVVVVLVFWVESCRGESERASYEDYMTDVRRLASASTGHGRELSRLLTTRGIRQTELEEGLNGIAQRQQQLVTRAQALDPPGRLRNEQRAVVEAFQFRVSGLRGLEDAFRDTARSADARAAGDLLATQARRLVASDVIWDDLFRVPAMGVLRRQGIGGVRVPDSNFIAAELASATAMRPVWERIHAARTGRTPGGLHGNGIVGVEALPEGEELSESTQTEITARTDLAFRVTVENSGNSQEVQVEVVLRIAKEPRPVVKTETIAAIDAGEQMTVVFRDLEPPIATPTRLSVEVRPVPGERNRANNTAEYPVIFSVA